MEVLIKSLISMFLIGLVVMAIIFFSIFGLLPTQKLGEILRGEKSTSTKPIVIIGTTTIIEKVVVPTTTPPAPSALVAPPPSRPATSPLSLPGYELFDITLKDNKFTPSLLNVQSGKNVKITLRSVDKSYRIEIPDYGLAQTVAPGETQIIAFQALNKGEFKITCDICGDFFGTLLIE